MIWCNAPPWLWCGHVKKAALLRTRRKRGGATNSGKDHRRQQVVAHELAAQIAHERTVGEPTIAGVMLESFLVEGKQDLDPRPDHPPLVHGRSVTDACLGWDATVEVLERLAAAVPG